MFFYYLLILYYCINIIILLIFNFLPLVYANFTYWLHNFSVFKSLLNPREPEVKGADLWVKEDRKENDWLITLFSTGLSQEILFTWLKSKGCQQLRSQAQADAEVLWLARDRKAKLPHHRGHAEAQVWSARCRRILAVPQQAEVDFQSRHLQVSFTLAHLTKAIKPFS